LKRYTVPPDNSGGVDRHRAERRARRRGGAYDKAVPPASQISQPAIDRGKVEDRVAAA
jgi:hypothetical protein